ncbi:MAG: polyphosphate polymerase domain-containing protein [Clostridia bacterium]|nr:polyphosphate polymerase domain-containing protein [Clostridia bacterium]
MYQSVFKRFELKYLLTDAQKAAVLEAMEGYVRPDVYGKTTIRNLYFDTETYYLIRRSLEKPVFKEKLRLRSYRPVQEGEGVFAEIKRKYDSVVYKRRLVLPQEEALAWLSGKGDAPDGGQIAQEISYFASHYAPLSPKVFLAYDREAYEAKSQDGLRITFDTAIRARTEELTLGGEAWGSALLEEGRCLMEIKTFGAIPLWLCDVLSREKIYKTPFSKYGAAYTKLIYPNFSVKGAN